MAPETADAEGDDSGESPRSGGVNRRTLIRVLVALGLGIPVAVEGATFLELIRSRLFGEESGGTAASPTTTQRDVGVGDDLLAATPQPDTVVSSTLLTSGDPWTYTLTVEVENTGNTDYELRLGRLWTRDGQPTSGASATTGQIPPGETRTVMARWAVPPDSKPAAVRAIGITFPGEGQEASTVSERVPLGSVSVNT